MASFTDTQPPRFNPYIQQQPVEAMVAVGTQKQKAHEEGVQKIQTQIDNIGGLDVVRDVDKAYLQSKINELGNNLRSVAAGDYSNFQFVNSVSGMTKQVGQDENVQNAVSSAAKYRKEIDFMEKEREKGNLNPANEYVFKQGAGKWLSSDKLDSSFNVKYDQFFDVDKFMNETFAQVKPDGYTIDQIYVTGPDGKPIINKKTGQPELSTTMKKLKKEGRFPEKVRQTIDQVFSDPRVSKQLGINGQYNYRGYDSAMLTQKVSNAKDEQLANMDNNISSLNIQLNATNNKEEKAKIQEQIDAIGENKIAVGTSYDDMLAAATDNPDALRSLLYRDETKNRYTSMYSNVVTEETIHENPGWRAEFDIQKERNDMAIKREDMRYKWADLAQSKDLALRKMAADYKIATLKKKEEEDAAAAASGYSEGPLDTDRDYNETFDKMGEKSWGDYTTSMDKLLFGTGAVDKKVLADYKKTHKGVDDDTAMRAAINAEAKRRKMTPYKFRTTFGIEANARLAKAGNTQLGQTMRNLKESAENAKKHFDIFNNARLKIDGETPQVKELGKMKTIETEMYDSVMPWGGGGTKVKLTPAMQYDMSLVFNDIKTPFSSDEEAMAGEAAMKRLNAKGITEGMIRNYQGAIREGTQVPKGMTEAEWSKAKNFMYYQSNKNFETNYKKRAEAIKAMDVLNPVVKQALASGDTKEDNRRKETLSTYVGEYASNGQNESAGLVDNAAAMQEILKDDKKGTVQYHASKDEVTDKIVPKAIFYSVDGTMVGEVTLSPTQAKNLGFTPEKGYQDKVVKELKNKMYVTNNNTTSFGDVTDPHTYEMGDVGFTKQDFTLLKSAPYDLRANIKKSVVVDRGGETREVYTNYVWVSDGKGDPKLVELPRNANTLEEATNLVKNLTPEVVSAILKTK